MDRGEQDESVRAAALAWIAEQVRRHGEVLPRALLAQGLVFEGRRVPLIGPQGIFTPAACRLPLTITTVPRVPGREAPYQDGITPEGTLLYRYRGSDPRHRDNVGLRVAMARRVPLIYLYGIEPGRYLARWPAYIAADAPAHLAFDVVVDEPASLQPGLIMDSSDELRRAYVLRTVRQRIHQHLFRERVITAYRTTCAVCRLRHAELLDAAHILRDGHPRGQPIVPNGLALCKLHHAAFDANLLAVRPDYSVEVRRDVLEETDGPMLLHGLQGVHNQPIVLPHAASLRPSVEFLEERYGEFLRAG